MHYIFETGYTLGDSHTAAAGTLILVALVIIITAVQFRLLPGKD
jgi:ABC-type sugar transport system permease subunit